VKPYTVLITGARGLCGTALVTHFTSNPQKWTVFTADRKPMNSATHVRHDLRRPLPIGPDAFPEVMDFVIHAAADVDEWTDSFKVIESNVRSTFNVARYAKATGALGLVNFSSVTVYGKLGRDRVNRESNTPRPATNYGLSKLLGEQVASAVADELPVASLRPAYVLGRPLNSKTLIARLARMIARGEPVTLENGSESFLQFIDSRDIAIICERLLEARISGTFNARENSQKLVSGRPADGGDRAGRLSRVPRFHQLRG